VLVRHRGHVPTVHPSAYLAPSGRPGDVYAPDDPALPEAIGAVGFAGRAFGVSTDWEDRVTRYRQIGEVRSEEFGAHKDDEPLGDG
jgi:hypothetical protein